MAPVVRSQFNDLMQVKGYWAGIVTEEMEKPQPEIYSKLYHKINSTKDKEKFSEVAGLGTMVKSNEYGDWNYDAPIQGLDKELVAEVYNLAVTISREAWDDDQTGILKKYGPMFARSARETKEVLAAYPFNAGFDTVTSKDGQYLFSTAHPYLGGGSYRNKLSVDADLSITSLQQAIIDMKQTTDERGKHILLRPKYLMVPDALEFTGIEILKSTQKPYTADNETNAVREYSLQLLVNPYLTDSDAWFLIHGNINDLYHPLKYIDRKEYETDVDRIETKSGKPYQLSAYMRCVFGAVGWKGIFGSPGAA